MELPKTNPREAQAKGQLMACEARIRKLKADLATEERLARTLRAQLAGLPVERQIARSMERGYYAK